jgi:ABC-type dipeptide/oligopeptide/nickel transport system permease subunit
VIDDSERRTTNGEQRTTNNERRTANIFPGLAIVLLVLGFNCLGDGLRDVADPKKN